MTVARTSVMTQLMFDAFRSLHKIDRTGILRFVQPGHNEDNTA